MKAAVKELKPGTGRDGREGVKFSPSRRIRDGGGCGVSGDCEDCASSQETSHHPDFGTEKPTTR